MNRTQILAQTLSLVWDGVGKDQILGTVYTKILSHFRRIVLEGVNLLLNHDKVFFVVGFINKRIIKVVQSIFLVYPASEEYASFYAYRYRTARATWDPWICGLLWQNKRLTIMFGISANNGQYTDPANKPKLRQLAARMEQLRQLLNANTKTFAGILPGILYSKRIIREAPEADITARAVCQAIELVKTRESLDDKTPIIVLGGRGFIGRRVVKILEKINTYNIDTNDQKNWPNHLRGKRVVVVNIATPVAINDYLAMMWPGTIVINEAYPEPALGVLSQLRNQQCSCYHIVGIDARAWPEFPHAYKGGIPCCAAWPSHDMVTKVKKMV